MNDYSDFYNDPLVSDEERAHVLVEAVEYRPGMFEARCSCGDSISPLESEAACAGWVVLHREVERSLAPFMGGGSCRLAHWLDGEGVGRVQQVRSHQSHGWRT